MPSQEEEEEEEDEEKGSRVFQPSRYDRCNMQCNVYIPL